MNLRSFSPLQLALGVSVALHAALLTVRFVDPEAFNRVFQDTPLEVILVNAHTNERPEQARAIAQATMAGGGDVDKGRATSPLPPALHACVCSGLLTVSSRLSTLLSQRRGAATQGTPATTTTAAEEGSDYAAQQRLVNCTINGHAISVPEGSSILSAAGQLGIHVSSASAAVVHTCRIAPAPRWYHSLLLRHPET